MSELSTDLACTMPTTPPYPVIGISVLIVMWATQCVTVRLLVPAEEEDASDGDDEPPVDEDEPPVDEDDEEYDGEDDE